MKKIALFLMATLFAVVGVSTQQPDQETKISLDKMYGHWEFDL